MADLATLSLAWMRHPLYRDLTTRQIALIGHLAYTQRPQHTRDLADTLGVAKPVITRAINTLQGLHLVERIKDADDRRNCLVQLTFAGRSLREAMATV